MSNLLPALGDTIGPYRLLRILGSGGQGTVYQAERSGADGLATQLAIKFLPPLPEDAASSERRYKAFLHEAYLLTLMHHPHIVTVFEVTRLGGFPCIVMEYVEGTSLDKLIEQRRHTRAPLPVAQALRMVGEAARALSYAQGLKDRDGRPLEVIHRDIKPANVLLGTDGSVKLTDFGLAHSLQEGRELTEQGVLKGTVKYMSPEQGLCAPLGHQTDVFSLGVVLFEAVTLGSPFGLAPDAGTSRYLVALQTASREVEARVVDIGRWCEPLSVLLQGMLAWDPTRRYPDARALLPELEAAMRRVDPELRAPLPPPADATITGDEAMAAGTWTSSHSRSGTLDLSDTSMPPGQAPGGNQLGPSPGASELSARQWQSVADLPAPAISGRASPQPPPMATQSLAAPPARGRALPWLVAAAAGAALLISLVTRLAPSQQPEGVAPSLHPAGPLQSSLQTAPPAADAIDPPPPSPTQTPTRQAQTPSQVPVRAEAAVADARAGKRASAPTSLPATLRFMGVPSVMLTVGGQNKGEVSLTDPLHISVEAGPTSMVARDVATGEVVWRHQLTAAAGAHYLCRWNGGARWSWREGRAQVNELGCNLQE